ncbi:putative membrane protein [Halorubrum sp. AJ67]|nr:putative membrane protein [Halorubrum sp. AJ67]
MAEGVLDSDFDASKARSYRNGFAVALLAGFIVLSYQYWAIGELAIETMGIFFSAAFVFIISQFFYTRGQ